MAKKRTRWQRIRRRFRWFGLGVLLLLAGLFALLTPPGLALLTPFLERAVSDALRVETRIEGVALAWPLEVRMASLEGRDEDEVLRIALKDVRIRLSLRELLGRRLRVYDAEVGRLYFAGLPEDPEPSPPREWTFPMELPEVSPVLEAVEIQRAVIKNLVLGPPLVAEEMVWMADAVFRDGKLEVRGELQRLGERALSPEPTLSVAAGVEKEDVLRIWSLDARVSGFSGLLEDWPAEIRDALLLELVVEEHQGEAVTVKKGTLRSPLLRLDLIGGFDLETGASDLMLTGEMPELARLQTWVPVSMDGAVQLQVNWTGPLLDPDLDLQLFSEELQVEGRALALDLHYATGLQRLTTSGVLEGSVRLDDFPVRIETGFSYEDGELSIPRISVAGEGFAVEGHVHFNPGTWMLDAAWDLTMQDVSPITTFTGVEGVAGQGEWAGRIRYHGDEGVLRVSAFDWEINGLTLRADDEVLVHFAPGAVRMSPWTLHVGPGTVQLAGEMQGERLNVELGISKFPLTMFGFDTGLHEDAELEGGVTLGGTPGAPEIDAWMQVAGIRAADGRRWDGQPANFRGELSYAEERLKSVFELSGLPGDPVALSLDLPFGLSLQPFEITWALEGPVEGHLRANTDLAGLGRLFVLDVYHRFSGRLEANIDLTGSMDAPHLEGGIRLRDGRYEHELSGTVLRNLVLEVRAERDFLELIHFSAADSADGEVRASGRLAFAPRDGYPFEVDVTLRQFRVVNNDVVRAYGRGNLNWAGNLGESLLTGELAVHPVALNIPENLPPRLYALEVVEIHGYEEEGMTAVEAEPTSERARHRIRFDVRVNAPDRIFVRGRGLDSEWSARIRVRGETPEPEIEGRLTMVRGRFQFFGRRLVLNRGVVTFDGAYPPMPLLDLEAQARSGGVTAILRVQGPADDPIIELDGSPPMPEDEILARLLFGREAARISPWQAITLTQAVNKLRGGGSAFDLMGETRRVLGVDQIDVRTPDQEQEGTTVTVGKYISDRVYLELERNVGAETGGARVEVELTPTLRLETHTGGHRDTGIGLLWTRDY